MESLNGRKRMCEFMFPLNHCTDSSLGDAFSWLKLMVVYTLLELRLCALHCVLLCIYTQQRKRIQPTLAGGTIPMPVNSNTPLPTYRSMSDARPRSAPSNRSGGSNEGQHESIRTVASSYVVIIAARTGR